MATNHISADQQEALTYLFANPVTVAQADEYLKKAPPMPYGEPAKNLGERTIVIPADKLYLIGE
jgi:hypothetical protein